MPTLKRLFALSGNRCAFPRCVEVIVHESTVVGKICHIKAANPGGPRYDPQQTAVERHGYDNLVLLCGKHSTVIDDDEEAYTVERLRKMKVDHERGATRVDDDFAERAAKLLFNKPVISVSQYGGITAHTINARTIHVHSPSVPAKPAREQKRSSTLVGYIEQIVFGETNGQATCIVNLTIRNLGTPTIVDGWHMSIKSGENNYTCRIIAIQGDMTLQFADRKLAAIILTPADAIYEKTIHPISRGGQARGWIIATASGIDRRSLNTEGTVVEVSYRDVKGKSYLAAYSVRKDDAGPLRYIPGAGGQRKPTC